MTHLYVLNPNARVDANGVLRADSDGDGLFDDEEASAGTDPSASRSNGYCFDGFRLNPTFNERCMALAQSHSCDPSLDSDGDSLNECEESLLGTNPFDFDSDGDGAPDTLEWLYGYNPLADDSKIDANADGNPNLINFSYGLPANLTLSSVPAGLKPDYRVNYMGREQINDPVFGKIWVELNQVLFKSIPLAFTVDAPESMQTTLYSARATVDPTFQSRILIPNNMKLISNSGRAGINSVLAIARIIDVDDPRRAYWRIQKWDIHANSAIIQPNVDLSAFRQLKARDAN